MKLNQYQRAKFNKLLIIVAVVLVVLAIFAVGIYIAIINERNQQEADYTDTVIGKNYFEAITINTKTKKVERDGEETTLREEFGISEEQETLFLSSEEELTKYFEDSTIDISNNNGIIKLTNKYQTKIILVEASSIQDNLMLKKK